MTAVLQRTHLVSVEDYLAHEQSTEIKHEYLAGQIVAMGGASDRHGLIATSLSALLLPRARRKGCQLFVAGMKVRIDHQGDTWFYYPDLVLACDLDDRESLYRRNPCLIVEVLSPGTEHIDQREKLIAYRLLPGLREYLLLRQDRLQADLYRRTAAGGWSHVCCTAPEEALALECLDARLTLRDIYADLPDLIAA